MAKSNRDICRACKASLTYREKSTHATEVFCENHKWCFKRMVYGKKGEILVAYYKELVPLSEAVKRGEYGCKHT